MNWGALLQFFLTYIEKNPQLVEGLLTSLLNTITGNPQLQQNLLNAVVNHFAQPKSPS